MSSLRKHIDNISLFGAYRAPATKKSFRLNYFCQPRNHPN